MLQQEELKGQKTMVGLVCIYLQVVDRMVVVHGGFRNKADKSMHFKLCGPIARKSNKIKIDVCFIFFE